MRSAGGLWQGSGAAVEQAAATAWLLSGDMLLERSCLGLLVVPPAVGLLVVPPAVGLLVVPCARH